MLTYDINLQNIITPYLACEDFECFLCEKGCTYKTGDKLLECYHFLLDQIDFYKMYMLNNLKRGVLFFELEKFKRYGHRQLIGIGDSGLFGSSMGSSPGVKNIFMVRSR